MTVGSYIKQLRTEKNMTQEELGQLLGVKRAAVQKWECDKVQNLKRDTIQKLSKVFAVKPSSFIIGKENISDYYRILLSDQGLKAIIKQLKPRIEKYGIDELAADIEVEFQDIKIFLSSDSMYGHKCLEKLEDILVALDTNIYELISDAITTQNNLDESFSLYQILDVIDKAEIRGEMKNMLKADKYHAAAPQKQIYTAQIAAQGHGVENIEVNVDMDAVQEIYDDLD